MPVKKKVKDVYLGPDFETGVRKTSPFLLAEVIIRRVNKLSEGFTFGKYLRNMASNKPFNGLDIAIEDKFKVQEILDALDTYWNSELIVEGHSDEREATFRTYKFSNPKTKTKIDVTFWTGDEYWSDIGVDADVNALIRTNENRIEVNHMVDESYNRDELISKIKKGEFEEFGNTKENHNDLKSWAKMRSSVRSNGKEGSRMENFKKMVTDDTIEAGYRMAGRQMTKGVKGGLLLLMKNNGADDGKLAAIKEVMDTEIGDAVISTLLGYTLTYVPQLQKDPRAVKLAEEFRVAGMATAGNLALDTAGEYFLPAITDAMSKLPVVEAAQDEKVRVFEDASNEECETEQEEMDENQQASVGG